MIWPKFIEIDSIIQKMAIPERAKSLLSDKQNIVFIKEKEINTE